jgi:hypothetical protein
MPLKLSLGLTEKHGLPDYGSIAAACHVELELDSSLLHGDLEGFHRRAREAYAACRRAVQDELARHQPGTAVLPAGQDDGANGSSRVARANGQANGNGRQKAASPDSNGHPNGNGAPRATQKQFDYLNQLARQIDGLGVRRIETLATKMFGRPVADLTSLDASSLIDTLKAIKAGQIDVETALGGAGR